MLFASDKTHSSLEPMYTTVNPNLPTFTSSATEQHESERRKLKSYELGEKSEVPSPDKATGTMAVMGRAYKMLTGRQAKDYPT